MGIAGIGVWQLLIILLIVMLLFGSKRLGSLGGDLGRAISGFRQAMYQPEEDAEASTTEQRTETQ